MVAASASASSRMFNTSQSPYITKAFPALSIALTSPLSHLTASAPAW